ncbi:MAG: indole-3-glycerol-phosphate synthase [Deferribacterales bacterium]
MSVLEKILENKRKEVKNLTVPFFPRKKKLLDFKASLMAKPFICEVKKASPTLGDINVGADPVETAKRYELMGAGAVSVLTDKEFFKGSFEYLRDVANSIDLPVLCKDFIIDEKQIYSAYVFGADAVLLMASALSKEDYERLYLYAKSKGLTVLTEIHEEEEYDIVSGINPDIVGVNARNLKTLEIDMDKAAGIISRLDKKHFKVAESGMKCADDIRKMRAAGADAFLVGSGLMSSPDPQAVFSDMAAGLKA